jgi:hypothetical protein
MTSLLQFVASSQMADAGTAASAGQFMQPDPAWLASLVDKAMKPCRDAGAAREAQQVCVLDKGSPAEIQEGL